MADFGDSGASADTSGGGDNGGSDNDSGGSDGDQSEGQGSEQRTETKAEAAQRKLWKIRGKDLELDDSEVQRRLEKEAGSHEAFEAGAKMRKQAEALVRKLKEDPESVLSDPRLGIDIVAMADKILKKRLDADLAEERKAKMSPAEIKALEEQEELQRFRDRDKTDAEKKAEEEFEQQRGQHLDSYGKTIIEAMSGSFAAKDAVTMRSAALFIKSCLNNGYEPDAQEIKEHIESRGKTNVHSLINSMSIEQFRELVGAEFVKKFRQHDLDYVRSKRGARRSNERMSAQDLAPSHGQRKKMDPYAAIEQANRLLGDD